MTLQTTVHTLTRQIAFTALQAGRNPDDIRLLAVSKGQSASQIACAFTAGLTNFGESYWQQACPKLTALEHLPLIWHFIGRIQRNKIKFIAPHFNWVHSVSSLTVAEELAKHRPPHKEPLQICLQINLDAEPGKDGMTPNEVAPVAQAIIASMPTLRLRGLMAIPKPLTGEDRQYQSLLRLKILLETLNKKHGLHLDTLSMGMSDDWHAAIRAGSTLIRLGRAIFGPR